MKIGIISATGKAGSQIAAEAARRGHAVTAIVRDPAKVADKGWQIIAKDLFSLTTADVAGFDAVVSAFGTAFDEESAKGHVAAARHLIGVFEKIPSVRLLIVGGAASLYTDPLKKHQMIETLPKEWLPVPTNQAAALEKYRQSSANWTFFSPAGFFDAEGERTGTYTPGTDFVITNGANESYISYADYAVAMVDEIENGFHIRGRFTAVSEKKQPQAEDPDAYYGLEKKKPVFEGGISRYRAPFNYELAGKRFSILMDLGEDIEVNFVSGSRLEWTQGDGPLYKESYECGKAEELAYFVNFELTGAMPRTNITLILDLETRLVTVVKSFTRFHKRHPYLVDSTYDFGAIDLPGYPLPKKRHGFTTDLVGKRVHWHYAPEFSIVHVYYHPNYIRGYFLPEALKKMKPQQPADVEAWMENPYDEKGAFIKVRDGLYLVNIIEQSMARRGKNGNSLLFLMNTVRVHDVGRSFGHSDKIGADGYLAPENYMLSAYGDFIHSDGEYENKPPFYVV